MASGWILDLIAATMTITFAILELRKTAFHSKWMGVAALFCLLVIFALGGFDGLKFSGLSVVCAAGLTLPMVFSKTLTRKDFYAYATLSVLMQPMDVVWVLLFTLAWAAVLGFAFAARKGEVLQLASNAGRLISKNKPTADSLHRVSFAVSLFLGWSSSFALKCLHLGQLI